MNKKEAQKTASCQTAVSGLAFSIHDLKCGNIVNYDTAEGEILPTVIDWKALRWLTVDPKSFNLVHSPIPFSDDILFKLGFELVYESDFTKRWDFTKDTRFDFMLNKNNESLSGIRFKGNTLYYELRFVHQFQNFYYCLTGECCL